MAAASGNQPFSSDSLTTEVGGEKQPLELADVEKRPLAWNGLIFSAFQLRKFTKSKTHSNKTPLCLRQEAKWGKGGGEGTTILKALGQWAQGLGPKRTAASGSGARGRSLAPRGSS